MEPQTIFIIIASMIFTLTAYFIPKKLRPYEMYATSLFATLFGLIVDMILALKYKIYVLDSPGVQIPPLIGQVILYSTASIIILNFFPFYRSLTWKGVYVLGVTLVTLVFEWLCLKFGFIQYYKWSIWYSALSYPFLTVFLILHYKFFQWLVERGKNVETAS